MPDLLMRAAGYAVLAAMLAWLAGMGVESYLGFYELKFRVRHPATIALAMAAAGALAALYVLLGGGY